jgi:Listeria-Bacteroides repeat domain (List_Bact_rpt).
LAVIPGDGDFTTRFVGYYEDSYYGTFVNSDVDSYDGDAGIAYSWTFVVPAGQTVTRTAVISAGYLSLVNIGFDANGGTGEMSDMTVISDNSVELPECSFTRDGYTFDGWATSASATAAEYADGDSASFSSDTTLYAVWNKVEPVPEPEPEPSSSSEPVSVPVSGRELISPIL